MPRGSRRLLGTLLALLAFGLVPPVGPAAAHGRSVGWVTVCAHSHRLPDDPLVHPQHAGAAHLHDFLGNTTTNASSTYGTLLNGGTNCALGKDRAAYWTPTLFHQGQAQTLSSVNFYYRSITHPYRGVRAFPRNLRVIAGDASATGPQDDDIVYWGCDDGGPSDSFDHPVDCQDGWVTAHINFPDCWDGVNADTPDHKAHMAYSVNRGDDHYVCPPSHPVQVPRLIFALEWPVHDGTQVTLSSGAHYTLHGDFINSWRQRKLRKLVARCIRGRVDCGKPGT
jgi:Domain of unknown function (DUF1996)